MASDTKEPTVALCENDINTIAEDLISSEDIVMVHYDDIIVVDDRWSILSTFSQQFVE